MLSRPLADLVRAAVEDEGAFCELVEEFAPMVWGVARSFGLDHADAADVSQGVWLRVATRLHTIDDPATIAGWLKTTTQRECLSLLRTKRRTVPAGLDLDDRGGPAPAPDAALIADERRRALWAAVASLPRRCQELLRLLAVTPPLSYDDIAGLLGVPRGSLGPTRRRCMEKLRTHPEVARISASGEGSGG
ncbi:MAG TPA: sigma-70 family RNA polymerase sigma factor [Acidimicrobiales bacterium]|jgi:RNA polymerase sigma factor (sigma-70 family)